MLPQKHVGFDLNSLISKWPFGPRNYKPFDGPFDRLYEINAYYIYIYKFYNITKQLGAIPHFQTPVSHSNLMYGDIPRSDSPKTGAKAPFGRRFDLDCVDR